MFENNNKRIIFSIAKRNFIVNKSRNLMAIAAIIMTTILFTGLFTVGISIKESMEYQIQLQQGDDFHGSIKNMTKEEFDSMKVHPLIKQYGYRIFVGVPDDMVLKKRQIEVQYENDTTVKHSFHTLKEGKFPTAENEIVTDTIVLDLLGVPHAVGENVTFHLNVNGNILKKTFVLSGYYEGNFANNFNTISVSKTFAEKSTKDIDVAQNRKDHIYPGSGEYLMGIMFENTRNISDNLDKILADNHITSFVDTGVSQAFLRGNQADSFSTMLAILVSSFLLGLAGYLLIYNIFHISVMKEIHFYGLLKTTGATKKQIKQFIYWQAGALSAIGLPIGLILGYGIGALLIPIISAGEWYQGKTSANPFIFIFSLVFSAITVFISCKKPGNIASKVSPVEAAHYINVSENHNNKAKKTHNKVTSFTLALDNLRRTKRKTALVVVSLSLSFILLNGLYMIIQGFDMDKFISQNAVTDFQIYHMNFRTSGANYQTSGKDVMTTQYQQAVTNVGGITDRCDVYFEGMAHSMDSVMEKNFNTYFSRTYLDSLNSMDPSFEAAIMKNKADKYAGIGLYGVNEFFYSKLNITEGTIDLEKFKTGNYVLVTGESLGKNPADINTFYHTGDKISLQYKNGIDKTYEVMAVVTLPEPLRINSKGLNGPETWIKQDVIISQNEFNQQVKDPLLAYSIFNVKKTNINKMENMLKNYTNKTEPEMGYLSKKTFIDQFKAYEKTYFMIGGGLTIFIGLIGILNFTNTMSTSIFARKKEFAILESIGMTKKQMAFMILYEGILYALMAIIFSITVGLVLSIIMVQAVAGSIWFFTFHITLVPIIVATPFFFLIAGIIPYLLFRKVKKESLLL